MKKRNEDNPDFQEDNGEELSDEEQKELNRLLERLHQADYKTLGSIVLNIYKRGSWHVDNVENQNFYGEKWAERPKAGRQNLPAMPEALCTEEAEEVWSSLREAGFIVEGGYGLAKGVSANLATYIADRMAESLGITHKWKVFQGLWNIKNMAQLAGSWKETGKLPPRADEIDELF